MFICRKIVFASCLFSFMPLVSMEEQLSDILSYLSMERTTSSLEQIKVEMGCLAAAEGDFESLKHFIDSSNVSGNPKHKAFPLAPSAIEMVKNAAKWDNKNPYIAKVRALFTE